MIAKKSFKRLVKQCIAEVLTEPSVSKSNVLQTFESIVKECVIDVLKEDLGSNRYDIVNKFKEDIYNRLEQNGFKRSGNTPRDVMEYYKYNFATVQVYIDIYENNVHIERYYDSEMLSHNNFNKDLKLPNSYSPQLVENVVALAMKLKSGLDRNEPIYGGIDDLPEGFDPQSHGPNEPTDNPYPAWNSMMRKLEETEFESPIPNKNFSADWKTKGKKVKVQFFDSSTGKNEIKIGTIQYPQKDQVSVKLDNFKTITVPWQYVSPVLDPKFGVNENEFDGKKMPKHDVEEEGQNSQPTGETFVDHPIDPSPTPRTFQEIRDAEDPNGTNHDLTLKCIKCGTTNTCRCSKPKRTFEGICDECASINEMVMCESCFHPFEYNMVAECSMGTVKCPNCGTQVDQEGHPCNDVNEALAKFGLGPNYKPAPRKTYKCPKCQKHNAVYKEEHPDTDMNEMVLSCPDCGYSEG